MDIHAKLTELLSLEVENEIVEFKRAENQFDRDKLGKYISALSNEANLKGKPSAWLVFGIDDRKNVVGTKITDRQLNEYKREISNHTSPKCNFLNDYRVSTPQGEVIILEIPPAPKGYPVAWKGHRYGRDGESLVALHDFEYDQIKKQLEARDWSAQIVESATIDDLSKEAIDFARQQYKEKNPKLKDEINRWSDRVFLDKAKVTVKGKITHTAILLLGQSESEHFINPAVARMTWILKDKDNIEKDYEHFYSPFITAVEQVSSKIRNLRYRYIKSDTLFPDEVDQYDLYVIREALNNAIAHQDYTLGGKIIVVESEDGWLTFTNAGQFIPNSVEEVVMSDSPESVYRNKFLVAAMVNLNMIDTIGSGIKRMFQIQRDRFFPLPDYTLDNDRVRLTITGKVIDVAFARKLAQMPDLTLEEIILLDRVSKQKPLEEESVKLLKGKGLIEGRRPNYHISSEVAEATKHREDYIKLRGIENDYIQKIILEYLSKFKTALRKDLEIILIPKLSESLTDVQKRDKIKNQLQELKRKGVVRVKGKEWTLTNQNV